MKKELIGGVWYRKCPSCNNLKKINLDNFRLRIAKDKADVDNPSHFYTICICCIKTKEKVERIDNINNIRKKEREYKREYYKKNKEKLLEKRKEYRANNLERVRELELKAKRKERFKKICRKLKEQRLVLSKT